MGHIYRRGGHRCQRGSIRSKAGRKLHEHTHAEEQDASRRAAADEKDKADERHSRILQSGEAILLALVTIAAAWAGYAAAKWGTASRVEIAQSSTLRNLATRADLEALTTRNFDSSTFNAWFIAYTLGNKQKEAVAEPPVPARVPGRVQRLDGHQPAAQPARPARAHLHAAVQAARSRPRPTHWTAAATAKFNEGNNGGADQRRLHPDHRVPGRGAVPGRHRQHVQAAPDPVRADHVRHGAAHPGRRADLPRAGAAQPEPSPAARNELARPGVMRYSRGRRCIFRLMVRVPRGLFPSSVSSA